MGIAIKMPALSPTMEEGTLAKWLVKEGDEVRSGDILAEIETDKATMEFEAVDEGKIGKIMIAEGTEGVKVGTVIAEMAGEGGEEAAPAPKAEAKEAPKADAATEAPKKAESGTSKLASNVKASVQDPAIPEGTEFVKTTVREALRDAMAEEMRADERVFVIGEEVAEYQGAYKVTQGLLDEFGAKRVIDTPITEYGFAGIGTGAAMGGLRPVVEFMTFNFAMQAIDHIINSAAKTNYMSGGQMRCPIVFRGPNGAASRVGAQHSQNYGPWYAAVPGLIVIAPYDAADAKGLLKAAIRSQDPVVFLENELLYGRSFDVPKIDDYVLPIGKARIMRPGSDVTLVSYSIGVGLALEAAETLAADGIDAEVIDLRTLRPLDTATVLESLKKT
ncbi:MAG: pyruvate dehydrogenase complex E1 component subunit beta, partial [Alphaproteobacteria bacterium]|nr:pyruvate dehydrogenase complex E1 component subunit beta [Alphaproteobacteria bacterium]